MTVIAWDGKTLAADRRAVWNSVVERDPEPKLRVAAGVGAIATSGDRVSDDQAIRNLREIAAGARMKLDFDAGAVVVLESGRALHVSDVTETKAIRPGFAIGSGGESAICLMRAGLNAVKSVEIVSEVNVFCGDGVDAWSPPV